MLTPFASKSQFKASIGTEVTRAMGKFGNAISFGFGVSGGVEYAFTNKFGLMVLAGYIHQIPNNEYKSSYMIPVQATMKFYFNCSYNGPYMTPILGIHKVSITKKDYQFLGQTTPGITNAVTNASFGFGMGYLTFTKFDFYFRINWASYGYGYGTYLALRFAREF